MLRPKRTRYRKYQKGRIHGKETRTNKVYYGTYGLIAMDSCRITASQIEAARIAINRHIKRIGKLWIRIFPDIPVSTKPTEVRMGKGKGSPEYWVVRIRSGRILFEIDNVSVELAKKAFMAGSAKLPIHTKIIKNTKY